jgi:hypothetical protein
MKAATGYFMIGCPSWKNIGKVMGGGFYAQAAGIGNGKTMQKPVEDVWRK